MSVRKALLTALFWVALALAIDAALLLLSGGRPAAEFLGAFCMEEALSLDNLFMFYLIFSTFHTPAEVRPRVLAWGIIGVIVLRGLVILGGTALIGTFRPVLWIFALFLFWSAYQIFSAEEEERELSDEERQAALEQNWLVRLSRRFFGFDTRAGATTFFTRTDGRTRGTILLLTLLVIEGTDLPFAFDSLPAAMAVSQNFLIVLVSNLLAVLSLRAIYSIVERMEERFSRMNEGIGVLLALAAIKILLPDLGRIVNDTIGRVYPGVARFVPPRFGVDVPLSISLGAIVAVIALTIGYTLIRTRPSREGIETAKD